MTSAGEYAAAGVDLASADEAKARIGAAVAGTRTALSVGKVGAFGGMVRVPAGMRKPTLVLSTDGVGTKVLVALQAGRFDTVGEDLVNHSVNDILVHGATPIAFMDYIAGSGLGVEQIAGLVEGIARGCRNHGMALAGGETAQMPGLYQPGTYDLAGTIIGVVEEDEALHGDAIVPGDMLLGYASTGLHTNGYTLARRIMFERMELGLDDTWATRAARRRCAPRGAPELRRERAARDRPGARARAHHRRRHSRQSGARAPAGMRGGRGPVLLGAAAALFAALQRGGRISTDEMREVFNLGVGLIAVLPAGCRGWRAGAPRSAAGVGDLAHGRDPSRGARPCGSRALTWPDADERDVTESDAMARALELAWQGWGQRAAQPLVGAVVLRDGAIVGEGWHAEFGGSHAEPAALAAAGARARGATVVCTLEPCNHQGKQPPCTDALARGRRAARRRGHGRSESGGRRRRGPLARGGRRRGARPAAPTRRRRRTPSSSTAARHARAPSSRSSSPPRSTAASPTPTVIRAGCRRSRRANSCSGSVRGSMPSRSAE